MTTTMAPGGHRFRHAAAMEWIKLRSLRSTWWTLAVTVAGAAAIAVAVGVNTEDAAGDLTNNALAGIALGLLLTGILGVLTATSEHSSGTIRSTLAAIPNRPLLLAAKAAVFGVVALAARRWRPSSPSSPAGPPCRPGWPRLGQPGVLRAVVLGGAGYCLIGLLGLGLRIVRHTPLAVGLSSGACTWSPGTRRRACPGGHALPPDRDRGQLPDRGAARDGRGRCRLPVALGRPRRARRLRRPGPGRRGMAARHAGRLSRTMGGMGGPLTPAVAVARAALLAPVGRRAERTAVLPGRGPARALPAGGRALADGRGRGRAPAVAAGWVHVLGGGGGPAPRPAGRGAGRRLATQVARRLDTVHRRLAARLLGTRVASPPPLGPAGADSAAGRRAGRRPRLAGRRLQAAKLPLAILEAYAVLWWTAGWST